MKGCDSLADLNYNVRYPIYIDLGQETYQTVDIMQGNKDSISLDIYITDNGNPATLPLDVENVIYRLESSRPDSENSPIQKDFSSVSGNMITFECIDEYITSHPGQIYCIIAVYNSSQKRIFKLPYGFYINVIDSPFNEDGVIHSDEFSALNKLLLEMNDLKEEIKDNVEKAAVLFPQLEQAIIDENIRKENETIRITNENDRVSEFDTLKQESITATNEASKVNVEVIEGDDLYKVKVTNRNGVSKESNNLINKLSIGKVETVNPMDAADVYTTGEFGDQFLNFKIPAGKPFTLVKKYNSVEEMNADYSTTDVKIHEFVIIDTGNINDADTSKIYMKDLTSWTYVIDLKTILSQLYKMSYEDIDKILNGTATEADEDNIRVGDNIYAISDEEIITILGS